jgi:dGTPase
LEVRYPDFPGLNLTWETRDGLKKHQPRFLPDADPRQATPVGPSLEAQVADYADEIAYNNHDIDDGLTSHMIQLEDLRQVPLWEEHSRDVGQRFPHAPHEVQWRQTVRAIINSLVLDLCSETLTGLQTAQIDGAERVRQSAKRLVAFSPTMEKRNRELKLFLLENLYRHYRVVRMAEKARRIVHALFQAYMDAPKQIPPSFYTRIATDGQPRVVCDYIAGMTDRFALDEYQKLFDPRARV